MNSEALVLSVSETMVLLMKSMGHYTHRRITTTTGKDAYQKAMQDCINHLNQGYTSLDLIKTKVEAVYEEVDHLYPKRLFNKRDEERRCHLMAVDQALDIIASIEIRFVVGGADNAPRSYRGRGYLYEDQSLFR